MHTAPVGVQIQAAPPVRLSLLLLVWSPWSPQTYQVPRASSQAPELIATLFLGLTPVQSPDPKFTIILYKCTYMCLFLLLLPSASSHMCFLFFFYFFPLEESLDYLGSWVCHGVGEAGNTRFTTAVRLATASGDVCCCNSGHFHLQNGCVGRQQQTCPWDANPLLSRNPPQ